MRGIGLLSLQSQRNRSRSHSERRQKSCQGENMERNPFVVLGLFLSFCISSSAQQRISLGGYWERWIAGHLYDSIQVPSSYRPVGTARLVRSLDLPAISAGERVNLR